MARYQAVRGTFDVLPGDMPQWQKVERDARELAQRFGYREIRTPLFEDAELFTRGMGVMAGLIEKELWTFQDKFGQKLALRTDATTGVIRAYQQNKLYNSKLPLKVFYLAPVFLLGKEGERRSRQSHQFGFEAIGSNSAALDAEVIALAANFCDSLGLEGYKIKLNSLGGKECRPQYLQKLKDYFGAHSDKLCSTCKRKYKANPDWVLSCPEEGCQELSQVAPTIFGMLTNEAKESFGQLREYLEQMELPVELDPTTVRDSEYYNGTVFEVRYEGKSLGFGGRYDTLVEKLGGKATPAVGFAFYIEQLVDILKKDAKEEAPPNIDVLLRPEGPESAKLLVPLLFTLRKRGVSAELDYSRGNGRRQKPPSGFSYLVTLDESNAFRGNAILRDLEENSDEKVPVGRLRNRVLHVAGVSAEDERDGSKSGRKKLRRGRRRSEEDRDDESEENSDSRSSRRRSRKSRSSESSKKSRDKETAKDSTETSDGEESRSSKSRRGRREKNQTAKKKEKPVREKRSSSGGEESGKALVPVFGLGAPAAPAPAKKKASKKKTSKRASSKSKAKTSSAAGSLNWSILPGKDD